MGVSRSPLVASVTGARLAHYERAEQLLFDPRAALPSEEITSSADQSERAGQV
jgi:hypothetical protein